MVPLPHEGNDARGLITVKASNFMLEMVQTKSATSSVTDHRGNIAVAGGGEEHRRHFAA